jgi:hypothetical protein
MVCETEEAEEGRFAPVAGVLGERVGDVVECYGVAEGGGNVDVFLAEGGAYQPFFAGGFPFLFLLAFAVSVCELGFDFFVEFCCVGRWCVCISSLIPIGKRRGC